MIIIAENKVYLPTNDFMFKKLFGSIGSENITKNLIESILGRKIGSIDLDGNTILEKDLIDDKGCILDIKAKFDTGELCDLEMQMSNEHNVEERILAYWSKLFTETIKMGNDYVKSKRTIVIFITKFEVDSMKKMKRCHTKWQIREEKNHKIILTNKLELHIIQLPNKVYGIEEDLNNDLMLWLKFIENPNKLEESEMAKNDVVVKAKKEYDKLVEDEDVKRRAELREMFCWTHEQTYDNGVKYGIEQGKEEGRKSEATKIAKELLKKGFSIKEIAEIIELDEEEIEKLK